MADPSLQFSAQNHHSETDYEQDRLQALYEENLVNVFRALDTDNNGYITKKEVQECLQAFGYSPSPEELTKLMPATEHNGTLPNHV